MCALLENDYNPKGETGIKDYVHIVDSAKFHIKGIEKMLKESRVDIPQKIVDRKLGDIVACYADPIYAKVNLN